MRWKGKRLNHGIRWIALNDEPGEMDEGQVACWISVALLAAVFGLSTDDVAAEVVEYRRQNSQKPWIPVK
ncbi:hypothetical protein [Gimesia algae]|uniref:Uncharacterized protein n=1 Tax=Gimesia algae TaxID=2527971 RepID=A0A517VMR3_9PLAN|nr:hypothetical protein [Gimesia algae]QDT94302.1 hypothetical protein Pan161_59970 [Gimesia algae]